jgi:NUMOD3 motif
MSSNHKVYGLRDPRDGRIRYIGKSINPEHRLTVHLYYARRGTCTHALRWMKGLLNNDLKPDVVILEDEIAEAMIDERERWWIAEGERRGWCLTNMTEGGDGGAYKYPESGAKISAKLKGKKKPPRTAEHSRKLAESHIGKKLSQESIAKRSETIHKKHLAGYRRAQHSRESIERQANALRGRKHSPETIERRADAARGKTHPDEWRQHISDGLKERHYVHPPEVIEKIAAKKRGTHLTDEQKKKISDALKRHHAAKRAQQET